MAKRQKFGWHVQWTQTGQTAGGNSEYKVTRSLIHTNKTETLFIRVNKLKSQSSVRSECLTNDTYILTKSLYSSLLYIINLNLHLLSIFLHLVNQKYLHKVQDKGKVHGSCHMKPYNNHAITQHTFHRRLTWRYTAKCSAKLTSKPS